MIPENEGKTLEEEVALMSREDFVRLQWLYSEIQNSPDLLLRLATQKNVGIDEAYAACRQKIIYYGLLSKNTKVPVEA